MAILKGGINPYLMKKPERGGPIMASTTIPGGPGRHHKFKKRTPPMNPEIFLNDITTAIENRDGSYCGMFIIGIDKGQAVCDPANSDRFIAHVLGIYKNSDLEKGLTVAQWDSLSYRVAKAWAQEKI